MVLLQVCNEYDCNRNLLVVKRLNVLSFTTMTKPQQPLTIRKKHNTFIYFYMKRASTETSIQGILKLYLSILRVHI